MSTTTAAPTARAAVRRPGLLTAAIGIVVVTALASIVNGVMIATGGRELLETVFEEAGLSAADLEFAVTLSGYDSVDSYLSTFHMRGYLVLAGGALLLLFGLCMTKAATWARVLVTISAALTLVFSLMIIGTDSTATMAALSMLAMLGAILAIIFTWLPANGRYKNALKAGH
ncbi:hypothetical protein [Actinophytocola sp.]|uniref:hypothetical protein n=1 Tax=Actinophytocola sp. TaxID=1872138 RepID=UPI002ED17E1F